MKKLVLIRHAKSSWDDLTKGDHQRPLNNRGKRDAPEMAELLKKHIDLPEIWLSSSATRALQTADYFLRTFQVDSSEMIVRDAIYHASVQTLLREIHQIDEEHASAIVFGHNPGITDLVDELVGSGPDNIPTCGISILDSETEYWANFEDESVLLTRCFYPKKDLPHIYG
jgi:phosphohistidine phosphatase